jgi:hypothetical protein
MAGVETVAKVPVHAEGQQHVGVAGEKLAGGCRVRLVMRGAHDEGHGLRRLHGYLREISVGAG